MKSQKTPEKREENLRYREWYIEYVEEVSTSAIGNGT
jgi:hypothetical protein